MFIVIEMQNGVVGNNVWTYGSRDAAFSKYHSVLSVAAVSSVECHACVILYENGQIVESQYFEHIPEPNQSGE